MKKLLFVCLAIAFNVHLFAGKVHCDIKTNFDTKGDTIRLCVYNFNASGTARFDIDSVYLVTEPSVNLNLRIGAYVLAFMHPQANRFEVPVYIENDEADISISVGLQPLTIPEQVDSVHLVSRNKEMLHTVIPMDKKDDTWVINPDSIPEDMIGYTFKVNNAGNYHIPSKESFMPPYLFFYMHEYNGEEIIFSENYYTSKKKEEQFKAKGYDAELYELYKSVKKEADVFKKVKKDSDEYPEAYNTYVNEFLKPLKDEQEGQLKQALIVTLLESLDRSHPVKVELYAQYKKKDREAAEKIQGSEEYKAYLKEVVDLLKEVDVTSPFVTSRVYYTARSMTYEFRDTDLFPEFGIPFGFFDQFLYDFKHKVVAYNAKGDIIFNEIRNKARKNPEKAEKELLAFKEEYATHKTVRKGRVDNALMGMRVKKGTKAPEFTVVSLEGDTIRLTDYKGKYVFLDFWGSWCGPCMGEIPNISKLSKGISADELVVIGLVCHDTEKKVKKVIEENEISYVNAIADQKLQNSFGVSSYPTTMLLDKEGVIIAKNMRGSGLLKAVKAKMQSADNN